ncbi:uncharacterized protein LOC109803320 [Cajanus cajan]|uniref:C2 domain-containing protein n=1 Tax=Cajanus cajan TaxID=3821 RepID=A0A151U8Z3_CAJCA|nr:uncharacterized protein LOC109803320 [Cajanus cajan]KYP75794.1 hypothetical protein KK1_019999 [Cajanus cajan]
MDKSRKVPSFSCELRIIQAQNVDSIKSTKNLFARLYLPSGNNKRIQLNTKKVSSNTKHVPFWNESFSLECSCPQEFLESLKKESLVLELRQSKMWGSSHVVGRGEIPWKAILESPNMEFKEWVKMIDLVSGISTSDCCEDDATLRAPQVQVEIKIRVEKDNNRRRRLIKDNWDKCGCKHGHDQHAWCSVDDYDIFALGAVLEAF